MAQTNIYGLPTGVVADDFIEPSHHNRIADPLDRLLGNFLQKLMADGAVYSIDAKATFYAGGALVELDPGDHADIAVVFDVLPRTDPETIELHADPLGPGVELPLP